ncbi:MAG TPA: cobyrinate a,c-diamide synthase [Stellaceae bacterium]|nr:cobyrinate a,c-diamide synthase [Stellaceae bacterium]
MRAPGLIIAAPASGSGKTLVTLGLLRHLRERGMRVAAAKAGPDYIDPTFHTAASGGVCRNLDLWAMRPATLAGLAGGLDSAADIVLCEGVMGLFDGTGPDGEAGSTAALARLTGWPAVLVVDARRQGASAAALVAGFARHDPALPFAGVIFNRVAGTHHHTLLEAAMARHLPDIPCLGALPHDPGLTLPERHLGLVPAGEHAAAEAVIVRAASLIAERLDVDRLLTLARPATLAAADSAAPLLPLGTRIAIARDDAFLFAYPAVLQGWREQGAELSFFAPLADEPPDPATDAIYLPGGYPELHAGRLASAGHCLAGLRRAASAGVVIYGECGGYMALGEALTDADGNPHRMAGLLPLKTSFADRGLHLGYRDATVLTAGPLGAAGARFRGHEFHYATTLEAEGEPLFTLCDASGHDLGQGGLRRGSVMGSFIHLVDRAD